MKLFEAASMGRLKVANRLVRSATFEGMCDHNGLPHKSYGDLYEKLAGNGVGTLITGFTYISREGSAIQSGQAGIDSDEKIAAFSVVTERVHAFDSKIVMQLAHTGRQTRYSATGHPVVGVSSQRSSYFRDKPLVLSTEKIYSIIEEFSDAAARAQKAGFDGVQLHAAHGYLIHQFILPSINSRKDEFGINQERGIGIEFLDRIIDRIRDKCGNDYPILVKISGSDDLRKRFTKKQFVSLIQFLDGKDLDGIEISYGTMENALNIFRGSSVPLDAILEVDPVYKINNQLLKKVWKACVAPFLLLKQKPFRPLYNMDYIDEARNYTKAPLLAVGGIRSGEDISSVLTDNRADFISMSRPFITEPDFARKLRKNSNYKSQCTNCNICAVMTLAGKPTACHCSNCQNGKLRH